VKDLIKLTDIIINNLNNNHLKNIWDISDSNLNLNLNISNIENGYKQMYHIHNVFNWFVNDPIFYVSYKLQKSCSFCFNKKEEDILLHPLMPINILDLTNTKSLTEYLYYKFSTKFSVCYNCSYESDKKIKKDVRYSTCVTHIIHSLNMPFILTFAFELSKIDNDTGDLNQYDNLIKYRTQIKDFIKNEFVFNNITYKLYGIIFMKEYNHYTAYCNDCLTDDLNLVINESYYYDDLIDNGKIELITNLGFKQKLETIIKYNPFIIIYIKKN